MKEQIRHAVDTHPHAYMHICPGVYTSLWIIMIKMLASVIRSQ